MLRQVHKRFQKWKHEAGISERLTIQSFRVGFATVLYRSTNDILLVSLAMGHHGIRNTKRYIHVEAFRVKQAVEKTFCR